jgi:hypothetical protein
MTIPRAVSATLAVVAVAMLATSTMGYSSVSVDRGVQVNVVEAEDAYVNVTVCETPQANGSGNGPGNGANPVKVTVTNQHAGSFTVESITWSDDAHPNRNGMEPGDVVEPGSSVTYNNAFGTDQVTVVVSGTLDAAVTVDVEACDNDNSGGSDDASDSIGSEDANDSNGSGTESTGSSPNTTTD